MIKRLGGTICVKCSEIIWDTDGDKKLARTLPQSCDINIEDYEDGDDLDDEIADDRANDWHIAPQYCYCINRRSI